MKALLPLFDEKNVFQRSISELKQDIAQKEKESTYAETLAACYAQEEEIAVIKSRSDICRALLQTIAQRKQLLPLYQQQKEIYLQNYTLFLDARPEFLLQNCGKYPLPRLRQYRASFPRPPKEQPTDTRPASFLP